MGARNAVKRGARATSKFAKTLAKKSRSRVSCAKAVGFLSEHLWILAVAISYVLYEKRRNNK